eukprot:355085-Rhodomonas_salina.1
MCCSFASASKIVSLSEAASGCASTACPPAPSARHPHRTSRWQPSGYATKAASCTLDGPTEKTEQGPGQAPLARSTSRAASVTPSPQHTQTRSTSAHLARSRPRLALPRDVHRSLEKVERH